MPDAPTPSSNAGDPGSENSSRERLDPRTRPMSNVASKAFVIGAFLFIFGLGTVGSYFLVNVAETALDEEPVVEDSSAAGEFPKAAPDSIAEQAPNPDSESP